MTVENANTEELLKHLLRAVQSLENTVQALNSKNEEGEKIRSLKRSPSLAKVGRTSSIDSGFSRIVSQG